MPYDHLMERSIAVEHLASQLMDGTLTLFLGTGASAGAELPSWHELIRRMQVLTKKEVPTTTLTLSAAESSSAAELQDMADEVRDELKDDAKYKHLVKEALYEGVTFSRNQLTDPMLIALGALMMGSRRGSVSRVVTLNFDCVLEWYVSLCGFVPRVVPEPLHLEGCEDVRIYHPHGFLPHRSLGGRYSDSEVLILGLESVFERLGKRVDEWRELLRHLFRTSVCLFCGLSHRTFKDPAFGPLVLDVGKEVGSDRPLGFWLIPDAMSEREQQGMLNANVVPVRVPSRDEVAPFLMEICQKASEKFG